MLLRALLTAFVAATAPLTATAQTEVAGGAAALELRPTPWEDGDFLSYDVISPNGKAMGMYYVWSEPVAGDDESERLWTRLFLGVGDQHVSSVRVQRSDLRAAESELHVTATQRIDAIYGEVEVLVSSGEMSRLYPVKRAPYDMWSMFHLLRRLPLQAGEKLRFPAFDSIGQGPRLIRLNVEADTIRLRSGRVECLKVTSSADVVYWVTSDEKRLPVRFEQGDKYRCELRSELRLDGELDAIDASALGCTMAAPDGWVIGQAEKAAEDGMIAVVMCLREPHSIYVELETIEAEDERDAKAFASRAKIRAKTRYRGYKARADSWTSGTIGGLPYVTFAADYREDGKRGWVQQRSIVRADRLLAEFVYRAPGAEFERHLGALEALVESYRLVPAED